MNVVPTRKATMKYRRSGATWDGAKERASDYRKVQQERIRNTNHRYMCRLHLNWEFVEKNSAMTVSASTFFVERCE